MSTTAGAVVGAATVATVQTFKGANQALIGPLAMDGQGDIFGTASGEGDGHGKADSTVFEIPSGSKTTTTVATFNGYKGYGIGSVAVDPQGDVFGTIAEEGGATGLGKVFEVPAGTKTPQNIAFFNGVDGAFPNGVILDGQGDLFGTAAVSGSNGVASVFEVPANSGGAINTVAEFNNPGASPKGLVMDSRGDLFGVNPTGMPKQGFATAYEVAKGSNAVTTLAAFPGLTGSGVSDLTIDPQGNLYGTTQDGGTFGEGTIFEIAKGSNTVTTLASFDGLDGEAPSPVAGVVMDAQGNLFGTTERGGYYGYGNVFELPAGSNTIETIASFKSNEGTYLGNLLLDGKGNLYGTINGTGGTSGGTIYKVKLPTTS